MPVVIAIVAVVALLLIIRSAGPRPAAPEQDEAPAGRMTLLSPGNFRVAGETVALMCALVAMLVVLVLLVRVTLGAVLGVLALSVVWLKIRQGQLLGQAVKVGPTQLAKVHACARAAARNLCIPLPDVPARAEPSAHTSSHSLRVRSSARSASGVPSNTIPPCPMT